MARCPNCEKVNPDSAQHCAYCGTAMVAGAPPGRPGDLQPRRGAEPPAIARRSSARPLIWMVVLLLVLLAGAAIGMLLSGGKKQASAVVPPVQTQIVTVIVTVTPLPTAPPTAAPSASSRPSATAVASPSASSAASPAVTTGLTAGQPDTPAGTVLDVGQTWRQDGLELNLSAIELRTDGVILRFGLTNRRTETTIFRFTLGDTFTAVDNRQIKFPADDAGHVYTFTLNPNAGTGLEPGCCSSLFIRGDTTSPALQIITLTVSGISSINSAKWRIPVRH